MRRVIRYIYVTALEVQAHAADLDFDLYLKRSKLAATTRWLWIAMPSSPEGLFCSCVSPRSPAVPQHPVAAHMATAPAIAHVFFAM